jgi:hypothetical protein
MGAYEDAAEARMAAAKAAKQAAAGNDEQAKKAAAETARKAAEEAGIPTKAGVAPVATWTKANTVNTANGPVDVDANGFAADGTKPIAVTVKAVGKVPAGFTEGPFPKELEQFFGSSSGVLGYRIETFTDKKGRTYNQLSIATGPNSSQTFGASFIKDANGKYTTYSPDVDTADNAGDTGNKTGQIYTAPDGRIFTDLNAYNAYIAKVKADEKARAGKSAYDILYNEFNRYGMGSLIEPLKKFIQDGLSKDELTLKLRETPQYQERFAANALRIKNGFAAIDEATYLGLEDKYQSIMQNYGLPASYYERGALGKQAGFENLIGGNVDPITLEERIMEGQKVLKGSKDIKDAIGQFYPGLNNGDFLAYVLDPKNALAEIKRKVAAAEIGGTFLQAGLQTGVNRAEEFVTAGINKAQAQQGVRTIAGGLQRGSQLASMLGEDPYTQTTAENEVFQLAGAQKATEQRQKITGLEKSEFGKKTGLSSSALTRDRAGAY